MDISDKLEEIEKGIDDLRGASFVTKATKAEAIVFKTVGLVRGLIEENENLKSKLKAVANAQGKLIKKVDNWDKNYFGTRGE